MTDNNLSRMLAEWADRTEGPGDVHRSVSIEPTGDKNPDPSWALRLSETTEGGDNHADWTTREWVVYGSSVGDVVDAAFTGGWISEADGEIIGHNEPTVG